MTQGPLTHGRRVLLVSLLIGLAVRLLTLAQPSALDTRIVDERHYVRLAINLLDGNGFAWGPGQTTSVRPPLYPTLLAVIWSVTGPGDLQAIRLCQIVLSLVTTACVYLVGRKVFGVQVGAYAAAASWLYPSLVFFNFTILTETLFTFLLVTFLLLAIWLIKTPRLWIAAATGVTLGAAALTRSVLWPLPLLFCPL